MSALIAVFGCGGPETGKTDAPRPAQEDGKKKVEEAAPAAAPARADLPNAEELLAAVVEASGGAARLDAITSFYQELKVEMPGVGISGTGKSWAKGQDWYLELSLPGVGVTMSGGKDGKLWALDPIQGLRTLSGKEAEAAAMGASINLAHDWRRFFKKAETTKVVEEGGAKIAEVTLTAESGIEVVLRIDLGTHRVIGQRLKQYSPMGEIPVEVTLSDYREQDGVWVAFEQLADMKLQKIKTVTTKLEFGVPVDESKFAQPGSEAAAQAAEPAKAEAK
ncbi:MAG TPA: hypothetical protein VIK91_26280 [Nannocystis sp.]